jgi:hypothetical protein
MKNTLILMMLLAVVSQADFTRADQMVTDSSTALVWQDDAEAKTTELAWTDAIDYCEALALEGHTNWRLPNFNELYSITDKSKSDPAMDATFQNVVSGGYWSSTTLVASSASAWVVFFFDGEVIAGAKTSERFVRCVRDGQ